VQGRGCRAGSSAPRCALAPGKYTESNHWAWWPHVWGRWALHGVTTVVLARKDRFTMLQACTEACCGVFMLAGSTVCPLGTQECTAFEQRVGAPPVSAGCAVCAAQPTYSPCHRSDGACLPFVGGTKQCPEGTYPCPGDATDITVRAHARAKGPRHWTPLHLVGVVHVEGTMCVLRQAGSGTCSLAYMAHCTHLLLPVPAPSSTHAHPLCRRPPVTSRVWRRGQSRGAPSARRGGPVRTGNLHSIGVWPCDPEPEAAAMRGLGGGIERGLPAPPPPHRVQQ
jgi:hypothetical protein